MIKEVSAGAVIFIREKEIKYLLLNYVLGHWDFVKGNVEKDENIKDTIIREAKEEADLDDLNFIPGFKEKINFFYKRKNLIIKEVTYLLAETKNKNVKISFEHKDFLWLNYEDALNKITFKNSKDILKKANKILMNSLLNY